MLPEPIQQIDRTWAIWRGQTLAYFAGCDYFRMASHPAVLNAAREALDRYGLNVGASRYTTGNHVLYDQLESALMEFFGIQSATLVANGFLTNLAVVETLRGDFEGIAIDARAHPSLVKAAELSGVPIRTFRHRDVENFRDVVGRCKKALAMTDRVFAHDGSIAPLDEYEKALPTDCWIIVDDSHGAGVVDFPKRLRERVVRTMTLSKAFGSFGGAILGSHTLAKKLEQSSILRGSTPFPLPNAAAALASLKLLKQVEFRERLRANFLRATGRVSEAPIFSIEPSDAEKFSSALLKGGVFPSRIQYPGGPSGGYFRFAISSEHTRAQLDALAQLKNGIFESSP